MSGRIEVFPDALGGWRFRVVAGNNEKVGASESYSTKAGAEEGVEALLRALGLEEEWGVRVDTAIGWVENTYHTRQIAEVKIEDTLEELESGDVKGLANPRLVHRLVTEWEEADE